MSQGQSQAENKNVQETRYEFRRDRYVWSALVQVKRIFPPSKFRTATGKIKRIPVTIRRVDLTATHLAGPREGQVTSQGTIQIPVRRWTHAPTGEFCWSFGDKRQKQSPMRTAKQFREWLTSKIGEDNADQLINAAMAA